MIKRSVTAVVLACALALSSAGVIPAGAVESNADKYYSVTIEKSNIVTEAVRTEAIDFEDLTAEMVPHSIVSGSEAGSMTRATKRIEWDVPAGKIMKANNAYSLEADELVTINCTYSPRTADLDFGFMTPDDVFHFTSGSDGSIRTTIRINETGTYYFAVRNNTTNTVEVLGYVYY